MVKKHAFCNDICAALEIFRSFCNYTKAIVNESLLHNYICNNYDDLYDTLKDYILKLLNKAETAADRPKRTRCCMFILVFAISIRTISSVVLFSKGD